MIGFKNLLLRYIEKVSVTSDDRGHRVGHLLRVCSIFIHSPVQSSLTCLALTYLVMACMTKYFDLAINSLKLFVQGIIDPTGTETFAEEPKFAKL